MNHKKENLSVVLVDDLEEEHVLFRKALQTLPYIAIDFHSLSSAAELELYLLKSTKVPDIIFLDMYMPDKNGLECLRDIRKSCFYKEAVVAIYSVSSSQAVIGSCLAAGANIYITKPGDFQGLASRLHEVIKSCLRYHSMSLSFDTFVKCL